ncbi:MAG: FtsX-like permease family protein [Clostridiales bacterium]|nr:FtsX-like permease family protein [Clostridiales bacterium]
MKKTRWIVLLRDIRKTWVSFLSIIVFVSLGVAIFLGIKWNEPALSQAMDRYLDEHRYHDLQMVFPYGFTEDDAAAVAALDGVSAVEGAYNAYGTAQVGGDRCILNIQSLTDTMDHAEVLEGELPAAADEVAVERLLAEALELHLGDTLPISALRGGKPCLKNSEFTITAIVEHPSFTRAETDYSRGFTDIGDGSADGYVLVAKTAFDTEMYDGCFSQLMIRGTGLDALNSLGSVYQQKAGALKEKMEALGAQRAALRSDDLYDRASEQIADAEQELADGQQELESGKQEYADGEKRLDAAKVQIADGEKQIAENEKKLADGKQQYADGLAAYAGGAAQLRAGRATLTAELEKNGYPTDLDEAEKQLKTDREKAADIKDLLMRTLTQVELYNEDHDSASEEEIKQILVDTLELLGVSEDINVETTQDAKKAVEKAQEYLKKYGSDAVVTATVNVLLPYLKLTADQAGVNTLLGRLDAADILLASYTMLDKDTRLTLLMTIVVNENPDLSVAPETLQALIDVVDDSLAQLDKGLKGIADYRAGAAALSAASARLAEASRQIEEGEQQLADAKKKLAQAKRDYAAGTQKLAQARQDIADGEQTLAENTRLLADAQAELEDFVRYEQWTVQIRTDNPSVATAKFYAQSSRRLCYSMALLFVFVGLMVCFTSITRSINESQTIAGVQKALGFRSREILAHYMAYSLLAAAIGVLVGYALGFFGIESVVNDAYAKLYVIGAITNVYVVPEALVIAVVELALIALATWLPCRKLLRRPAVELLKGENYAGGRTRFYEKWRVWQRMSLYTQTTVNNLMNDGARIIATLVGITGCTALIVMSLSLRSSILSTPVRHFERIWIYDASLVSDTAVPGGHQALEQVLDESGADYTSVRREAVYIRDETGTLNKADLIVPEDAEDLRAFIHLDDYRTGRPLSLTDDGVIVSYTYAKHYGLKAGDTLHLLDTAGRSHDCVVSGISQHYLSSMQVVMTPSCYQHLMGWAAQSNTLYLRYGAADRNAVAQKLQTTEGYFSLTDESAKWIAKFQEFSGSVMLVVYIGLSLSVTMALLVLLNLNIVCVNEKTNELVVMRINGFSIRAVKAYLYRDNIVLTALGILGGVGIGLALGRCVLEILQKIGDNFYTTPDLTACLIGAGLAALFSLATNLIALRRVNTLSVSDLSRV